MAVVPARNSRPVTGMCLPSPPSASSEVVCVWESMLPAPKKSSDLNSEWLSVWSSAPESPQIAASWLPELLPSAAMPSPIRTMPMFSIDE